MTDFLEPAPLQFAGLSYDELVSLAHRYRWVHSIDLGAGFITPGEWGRGNPSIGAALNDVDWRGAKVLDIGCWDGLYSFHAEESGAAEVFATDLVSQRDFSGHPTLQIAHAARKSRIKYYPMVSVYDIENLGQSGFDVVIFAGVYYHLRDPLRALSALRRVMKSGATIIVEGAILEGLGCYAGFFYRELFCGDKSNWWVPTVECLRQWISSSYLHIMTEYPQWGHLENQRATIAARAVVGHDTLYSMVPDDLAGFNR